MLYCCGKCRFVFEGVPGLGLCPDCGAPRPRPASAGEKRRYREDRLLYGPMRVYGEAQRKRKCS